MSITMTNCKFCHNKITWKKENGKYIPCNMDGTRHARRQCEGLRNQGNGEADSISDSPDFLGRLVTGTNDRLVLDIGPFTLDIRGRTSYLGFVTSPHLFFHGSCQVWMRMAKIKTDEKDEDDEYSPDPIVNAAFKEAAEGKDASVRYGDRETGFKAKKKNVRTRVGILTVFIPENERKYQRVCKTHQVDVKYNRHTWNIGMWDNPSKPGERLGEWFRNLNLL